MRGKKKNPRLAVDESETMDYSVLDMDLILDGDSGVENQVSIAENFIHPPEMPLKEDTIHAIDISSLSSEWPELQAAARIDDGNSGSEGSCEDITSMFSWDELDSKSEAWDVVSETGSVKSFNTFASCLIEGKAKQNYRDAVLKDLDHVSTSTPGLANKIVMVKSSHKTHRPTGTRNILTSIQEEEDGMNDDLFCFRSGVKDAKGGKAQYRYKGDPKSTNRTSRKVLSYDHSGKVEMAKSRRAQLKKIAHKAY